MLKTVCVICICLFSLPAICEQPANYEVATILEVKVSKPVDATAGRSLQATDYEVTARVGDTIYIVLYTDTLGTGVVQYAGGQQLLVHVGKDAITYNDILGRSQQVPIISRKPVSSSKPSKTSSEPSDDVVVVEFPR